MKKTGSSCSRKGSSPIFNSVLEFNNRSNRFYWILYLIIFVLLPINAPLEYWDDSVQAAIFVAFSLRYIIVINISWLISSAHFIWGLDKNHKQSDSNMVFIVTKRYTSNFFLTLHELSFRNFSYWPQYHYLLPFDYQSGEFGNYGKGSSTALIRVFAALGWATDLKTVTTDAVKIGLTRAVDTGKPVVDCLTQASEEEFKRVPKDHYLVPEQLL